MKTTVQEAVKAAKDAGYKQVWLFDASRFILMAEAYLTPEDKWKNMTIPPYIFAAYKDEAVHRTQQHISQPDTLLIFCEYDKDLQKEGADECRKALKEMREKLTEV